MTKRAMAVLGLLLLAGQWVCAQPQVDLEDFRLLPVSGVQASVELTLLPEGNPAASLSYTMTGTERRFLALEARVAGNPAGARSLVLRCQVEPESGAVPRAALLVFDADGESWYRVGTNPLPAGEMGEVRLPLNSLRPTAFSAAGNGQLDWAYGQRVWVGMVLDGPCSGKLTAADAAFTWAEYRPTAILSASGDGPGTWSVGQDPAVTSKLTTPNEGHEGNACMRFDFAVPGGRHMYAIPSLPLQGLDLEGYRALRFNLKANIPAGMRLLITLGERNGGSYFVEPAGPWADEWTRMEIPLDQLQEAGWGLDKVNHRLDVDQIGTVQIGAHGSANQAGEGWLLVDSVEFVP